MSKVLLNMLRKVTGTVVNEAQSNFVKGRKILDDIPVANEMVDDTRRIKKELLLFKIDFEKAYDSVDWRCVDDVMGR